MAFSRSLPRKRPVVGE